MMRKLLVTCFGVGLLPVMPGTYASAAAVAIYLLLAQAGWRPFWFLLLLIIFCGALDLWLCPWAERHFGRKDPHPFVLDELVGQWIVFLAPLPPEANIFWSAVLGFFLFRAFDVVKPFPIRRLEKLPAGWGVLLDDLLAGIYAGILLQAIVRLI